jgi:DNA-binding response OmpR family regulator
VSDKQARVLVADDNRLTRDRMSAILRGQGHLVETCEDGQQAVELVGKGGIDLVLLDIMMPRLSGLDACRIIKSLTAEAFLPVVLVTVKTDSQSRVEGLRFGADDYIAKPFELREVLARIKAVLRRRRTARAAAASDGPRLHFAGWTLDLEARTLRHADGRQVALTAMEFDLLAVMARRPGVVFTREQLQDLAHGNAEEAFDRSIDIRITRLRKKLETDPSRPAILKTVRGAGYVLADR